MPQASSWPYCNLTTDLQLAFKDIERYFNKDTLDTFAQASGQSNTYEKRNTGYYGAVWQNGNALTSKTSIADVESNPSSFYYDETNDILYLSMDDGNDPDSAPDVIEAATDTWNGFKTTMRNDAQELMESMLDPKYPRPIPFAATSYNSENYDFDIRFSCALLTCYLIISQQDPSNPFAGKLLEKVWNPVKDTGILWEYYIHQKAFSFETTKDEFKGNIEVITYGSSSSGIIYLTGNPDVSLRRKYRIKFTTAGVVETAKFKFSNDGGLTYGSDDAYTTYSRWFYFTGGLWIRAEGTFVLNDEWEITVADPDLESVKSQLGSIEIVVH